MDVLENFIKACADPVQTGPLGIMFLWVLVTVIAPFIALFAIFLLVKLLYAPRLIFSPFETNENMDNHETSKDK